MTDVNYARIELSAGGVIFRRGRRGGVEVLIIQDSYGNWGFPKGHLEEGEGPGDAALRECREETGLQRLEVGPSLGTTDWYFRDGDAWVHKYCDYFRLEADPAEQAEPQPGEGIKAVVWLSRDEAERQVTYANARHVLRRASE